MLRVSITYVSSCHSYTDPLTDDKSEFEIMVLKVLKDFNIVEKINKEVYTAVSSKINSNC